MCSAKQLPRKRLEEEAAMLKGAGGTLITVRKAVTMQAVPSTNGSGIFERPHTAGVLGCS